MLQENRYEKKTDECRPNLGFLCIKSQPKGTQQQHNTTRALCFYRPDISTGFKRYPFPTGGCYACDFRQPQVIKKYVEEQQIFLLTNIIVQGQYGDRLFFTA